MRDISTPHADFGPAGTNHSSQSIPLDEKLYDTWSNGNTDPDISAGTLAPPVQNRHHRSY